MIYRTFFLLIVLLYMPVQPSAADYTTPSGRVLDLTERILAIIDDTPQNREFRWGRMAALVYDGFDFRSRSQGLLTTQWRRVNEAERKKYTDYFSQYLEAVYYPVSESLIQSTELIQFDMATVDTVIHAEGQSMSVQYKLKNNNGNWFAFDVVINGDSLVQSYHSTYTAIISKEGMHGLTNDIQRRINKSLMAR